MIIARLYRGVSSHFPARASEWALAAILFLWGLNAMFTPDYFNRPLWLPLREMLPEELVLLPPPLFWGGGALLVAVLRLGALIVNGTFADTAWSRFSPHVRMLMSVLSCFFWTTQVLSVWASEQVWTGLSTSAVLLALDLYNIVRTSSDASHSDEVRRNGITGT